MPGLSLQSAGVTALALPQTLAGVDPSWTVKKLASKAEEVFYAAGLEIEVRV